MDVLIEISKYVETQKKLFGAMPLKSDFNDGIIEGLNLVSAYINMRIDIETDKILRSAKNV